MSEDPDRKETRTHIITKVEDDDEDAGEQNDHIKRIDRAPDLTPTTHKIFINNASNLTAHESTRDTTRKSAKSILLLRELHDNGREYVERLQEIREVLGDIRAQRNTMWNTVRERAVKELQDVAVMAVGGQ